MFPISLPPIKFYRLYKFLNQTQKIVKWKSWIEPTHLFFFFFLDKCPTLENIVFYNNKNYLEKQHFAAAPSVFLFFCDL